MSNSEEEDIALEKLARLFELCRLRGIEPERDLGLRFEIVLPDDIRSNY